ncbi:hypothetical protein EDB82DRAFT_505322 [Fusarium venenatum]|uniref:uncharacterized protein n=1 Tax=Fusarium venenatum TaxID=56646 RepID=UPI001D458FEF|nr:hypothetical protein EDB82DRAFT_505322 [Fusarium venenatum]
MRVEPFRRHSIRYRSSSQKPDCAFTSSWIVMIVRPVCAVATVVASPAQNCISRALFAPLFLVSTLLDAGRGHQCDSVQRLSLAPPASENGLPSPGMILPAIGAGLVWGRRPWVGPPVELTLEMNMIDAFVFILPVIKILFAGATFMSLFSCVFL